MDNEDDVWKCEKRKEIPRNWDNRLIQGGIAFRSSVDVPRLVQFPSWDGIEDPNALLYTVKSTAARVMIGQVPRR